MVFPCAEGRAHAAGWQEFQMKTRLNKTTCAMLVAGTLTLSVVPVLSVRGVLTPDWLSFPSALAGPKSDHGHDHDDDHKPAKSAVNPATKPTNAHDHEDEGLVHMTPAQAASHGVEAEEVGPGVLSHALTAPGVIAPDSDRIGRIAARVVGTVAVLNKRLGDRVERGEIVAELDSREVAEARSEYFAALTNLDLQKTLFSREQELWNRKVSAEQQYLRARNTLREVELRVDLAVKKLAALGLVAPDAAAARMSGAAAAEALQRYPLRAPISGRVVERRVDLGAPVGGEGHEKELYVIADLSKVWVDLAIPADDLPRIHEGQEVRINVQNGKQDSMPNDAASAGKVIFVSPMLSPDTRSARVIAELDNAAMRWRPGAFVTARVTVGEEPVTLRIPRGAVQRINGQPAVFVETPEGFRVREVGLGKEDSAFVAVTSGLKPGERVAARNAFLLKAELGKAEAEHAH